MCMYIDMTLASATTAAADPTCTNIQRHTGDEKIGLYDYGQQYIVEAIPSSACNDQKGLYFAVVVVEAAVAVRVVS